LATGLGETSSPGAPLRLVYRCTEVTRTCFYGQFRSIHPPGHSISFLTPTDDDQLPRHSCCLVSYSRWPARARAPLSHRRRPARARIQLSLRATGPRTSFSSQRRQNLSECFGFVHVSGTFVDHGPTRGGLRTHHPSHTHANAKRSVENDPERRHI
jgi:hypothetical protein